MLNRILYADTHVVSLNFYFWRQFNMKNKLVCLILTFIQNDGVVKYARTETYGWQEND